MVHASFKTNNNYQATTTRGEIRRFLQLDFSIYISTYYKLNYTYNIRDIKCVVCLKNKCKVKIINFNNMM